MLWYRKNGLSEPGSEVRTLNNKCIGLKIDPQLLLKYLSITSARVRTWSFR